MNRKNQDNKLGIIGFFLALIVLGCAGYILYLVYRFYFLDEELDIITILLMAVPIFVVAMVAPKFTPSKNNQQKTNQEQYKSVAQNPFASDANVDKKIDNYDDNAFGNMTSNNLNQNHKLTNDSDKQSMSKNLVPLIVLVVVFVAFFLYQGGYFQNSDPVGRWVFEMNEGEDVGGAINLTDYLYMEFYEDGTLEIGWKNVDSPEEEQGTGTWYQSENIIYFTIDYNYGESVTAAVIIKNNELVDAETDVRLGYIKD
jgi:hypothetical protein